MSVIGNISRDIGNDIKGVVQGVEKGVKGVGELAEGALTLNPTKALDGAKDVASGGSSAASSASNLTPEGLAATTMMEGGKQALAAIQSRTGSSV